MKKPPTPRARIGILRRRVTAQLHQISIDQRTIRQRWRTIEDCQNEIARLLAELAAQQGKGSKA